MKTHVKRHAYDDMTISIPHQELVLILEEAVRKHEDSSTLHITKPRFVFMHDNADRIKVEVCWREYHRRDG